VGTPGEIVEACGLSAVELEVERALDAAAALKARSEVDEVSHYGHSMRVATRCVDDPARFVRETLDAAQIPVLGLRPVRVTVEDAFVSTVRQETQDRPEAAA
jgi:hypothetical protein